MVRVVLRTIRRIDEIDEKLNQNREENMTATEETEPLISSRDFASFSGSKSQTVSYNAISMVSNIQPKY